MEETTAIPPSNETSTVSKAASSNSSDDSSSKRRPDQALYKPPRRSKNLEVINSPTPPPPPLSSTTISTEDIQQSNDTPKPVKTKTPRPSLEPYRPPSRRSQPAAKEIVPVASTSTTEKKCEDSEKKKIDKDDQDEEEEEDWEKLFDGNDSLVDEIQSRFKESVQIKKPINDYSKWSIDDILSKEGDLAHIVEVSNFPSTFHTEDLSNAFKILTRSSFDIKWVDDTHALVVFPDASAALEVLQLEHPMFKVCSMSQASVASKKKSKNAGEFLQPYKARPQTSSLTANRQICAALGMKASMSSNKTKIERQKIESAKQQKIRDKEEQNAVWDGAVFPTTPTS